MTWPRWWSSSRGSARNAAALIAAWTLTAGLVWPDLARAHGLIAKADLPIPSWLFAWAAGIVLMASFFALATLWTTPRFAQPRERLVGRVPAMLDASCGAVGMALFVIVVFAGLAGSQTSATNVLPTFVYVIFWVAVPMASVLIGDVFRAFNPWRAAARAVAWTCRRLGLASSTRPYPPWLGRWPAVATIVGFAWLELVYVDRDVPRTLAILALAYAAVQLAAMRAWGIETWTSRGDGFAVAFNLFARLAPLDWHGRRLVLRRPLEGIVPMSIVPGSVALVCVMIGATTFDGFSSGPLWLSLAPHVQRAFGDLGLNAEPAFELAASLGLVVVIGVIAGVYRLAVIGMRSVNLAYSSSMLSGAFAHTLVPIALAYIVAHYFSFVVYSGQSMIYLISDPLGTGHDYFGTATYTINYTSIGPRTVWYVQVAALVAGHLCGLVLAHDRALRLYRNPKQATRSQYWMLTAMVSFTSLGLWLLSQ